MARLSTFGQTEKLHFAPCNSHKCVMRSASIDSPMAMASQISYRITGEKHISGPRVQSLRHAKTSVGLPRHKSTTVHALPATLQKRCEEWLALDQDPRSRGEAQQAMDAEHHETLQDRMGERLTFGGCKSTACRCCCCPGPRISCCSAGTAGLRGLMGFGFNRMNEVVVRQTTQGFCSYLQAHAKAKLESRGVAIGEHASI